MMAASSVLPVIRLERMWQLEEAHDEGDDWTGITDATSPRKIQNRLNVRAHRRRKALQVKTESVNELSIPPRGIVCTIRSPRAAVEKIGKWEPIIPNTVTSSSIVIPLCSDHLITLMQYNALRASMTNHILLQPLLLATSSPTQECAIAAHHVLPSLPIPDLIPPNFFPTALQQSIPRESWVDIIPHPCWRDNALLSLATFDEVELWSDTIGGLFEGFPDGEIEKRGIIAWNPPWDLSEWEMSEGFWRKWGWLMRGFEREALDATNHWRRMRGEDPIH